MIKNETNFNNILKTCITYLGKDKSEEIFKKFETDGIEKFLADEELLRAVEIMCENSLYISKTSKATFMHRNTLLYRIDKIKRLTSLDVRKFDDAVALKILMMLDKINKD